MQNLLRFLLILGAFAALSYAEKPTTAAEQDTTWSRALVGTWDLQIDPAEKNIVVAMIAFRADGTFVSEATFRDETQTLTLQVEGKWQVKEGVLIEEITKGSGVAAGLAGTVTKDQILKLEGNNLETKNEEGSIERLKRRTGGDAAK